MAYLKLKGSWLTSADDEDKDLTFCFSILSLPRIRLGLGVDDRRLALQVYDNARSTTCTYLNSPMAVNVVPKLKLNVVESWRDRTRQTRSGLLHTLPVTHHGRLFLSYTSILSFILFFCFFTPYSLRKLEHYNAASVTSDIRWWQRAQSLRLQVGFGPGVWCSLPSNRGWRLLHEFGDV